MSSPSVIDQSTIPLLSDTGNTRTPPPHDTLSPTPSSFFTINSELDNRGSSSSSSSDSRTTITNANSSETSTNLINSLYPILTKASLIIITGTVLGTVTPKNKDLPTPTYRYISSIIGYIYFLCWSISFYPQTLLNYRRKSTQGLSTDFTILNVFGFLCYSLYTAFLFWDGTVRERYRIRNNGEESTVQSNDVAFALHALVLSSVTLAQIWYYGSSGSGVVIGVVGRSRNNNNNSSSSSSSNSQSDQPTESLPFRIALAPATCCFLLLVLLVSAIYGAAIYQHLYNLEFLDYLYLLSSIKVIITIVKYLPQVILNYNRKSTDGWNVWNVLLDFTGGTLSILQLVLDCRDMGDWSGITGNWAKFGLGLVSILFDVVFLWQHYVLYPDDRCWSIMRESGFVVRDDDDDDREERERF